MNNLNNYKKAFFIIKKDLIIIPDEKNILLNKYMIENKTLSFLIITAFDSNETNILHNREKNSFLENDLSNYNYFKCIGCDNVENPTHIEESFFVKNISFEDSIRLCKKYNQDCILWSNNDVPRLYDQNGNMI